MSTADSIMEILEGDLIKWNEEIKRSIEYLKKAEDCCDYKSYKMSLQRIEKYENMIINTKNQIKKVEGWK